MGRFTHFLLAVLITGAAVFSGPAAEAARMRAAGSTLDRLHRLLVVIAHPDDEVLLAPLLAQRCVRDGASCSFLVMT